MSDYSTRACSECRHWHRSPADPNNLGQRIGVCRATPPAVLAIQVPTAMGVQVNLQCQYPLLAPDFPACGRFGPDMVIEHVAA